MSNINVLKIDDWTFCHDFKVALLFKLYLTVSGINIPSLRNNLGKFEINGTFVTFLN